METDFKSNVDQGLQTGLLILHKMPTAHAYNQRRTEPLSVRFVHSVASAFAAAEFELLVICLFFVLAYALKAALVRASVFRVATVDQEIFHQAYGVCCSLQVTPDPYSQAFTSKPMLARAT